MENKSSDAFLLQKMYQIPQIWIYNGNYYSVIFGQYVNGGFFSIPNWSAGGEISDFDDVFWNAESIGKELKSKKAGKAIAKAIAKFAEK